MESPPFNIWISEPNGTILVGFSYRKYLNYDLIFTLVPGNTQLSKAPWSSMGILWPTEPHR